MIPEIDADKCTGCSMCTRVCPHEVIEMKDGKATVAHPEKYDELWGCIHVCPVGAITKK